MKRVTTIILLCSALLAFWISGRLQPHLLEMRREYHLDQGDPLENSPPLVAFTTVALGGFRGVIADLLWVRASKLQEEGRYFELVQLSTWITRLEPRFPEVWAFHAWNLAYNISVLFNDPTDRWRWVQSGIRLLRDEGLRYNPTVAQLYRELGWLFQHKVGGAYDQAHTDYKRAWAAEMMKLFDGPRPDYAAWLAAPTNSPLWKKAERMRTLYQLDPALMQQVDDQYGPLDWRLPQAHAIYWAWRGQPYAEGFEKIAIARMIFQSMADAFRQGNLYFDPDRNLFIPSPNLDILPQVLKAFKDSMIEFPDQETMNQAYANFVAEAIVTLYTYNRTAEARRLFEELSADFPSETTAKGFDGFIYDAFTARLTDIPQADALALVEGSLYQSRLWAELGEEERANGFAQLAALCWKRYMATLDTPEQRARVGLPPLKDLQEKARQQVQKDMER